MELVRRKLDFDVIKDNYENKVTSSILEYADLDQGMPGTNYKHKKIKALMRERELQIQNINKQLNI